MKLGSSMRRRRRRGAGAGDAVSPSPWIRVGLLALALVLGGYGVGYLFATQILFPAPEPIGELNAVPDVRGLDGAAAEARALEAGLALGSVDSVRHPSVPAGVIFGQSPLPGQLSLPGGPIDLTVSMGPEVRPVPELVRLAADRALVILDAAGFTVSVDSVDSDEPAGRVLATEPPGGQELVLTSLVQLVVSRGPAPVSMPDLVGLDETEARFLLDSLGLQVSDVVTRFAPDQEGRVIGQDPPADSLITPGSAVRLIVGNPGPIGARPEPVGPVGSGGRGKSWNAGDPHGGHVGSNSSRARGEQ